MIQSAEQFCIRIHNADGDTVGIKGVWLQESNKELRDFIKSKSHYINFSGNNVRTPSNEAIQSLYSMTKILDQDKSRLTKPTFQIKYIRIKGVPVYLAVVYGICYEMVIQT